MKNLSPLDTMFVTMDSERYPLYAGGMMVFDPSTSPEPFTLDRLKAHLLRLIPVMTPMHRRLVRTPFGLRAPVWIADPDFDIDNHLHHIAVPSPGGDRELANLADEITSVPLDWHRPLWDMWFIEGLANGRVALFMRMHHAAVDGMGGLEMLFQMFSPAPDGEPLVAPTSEWKPEPVPSSAAMLLRSVPSLMRYPLTGTRVLGGFGLAYLRKRVMPQSGPSESQSAPLFSGDRLPFNEIPDGIPHKSTAWTTVPMADVKAIRELHGCTVNDVALAISAAAVRRWLLDHDALPEGPFTCGNPVNVRTADEVGAFENHFTIMAVSLPTHIADPVDRLTAVSASASAAKQATAGSGSNIVEDLFEVFSPGVTELLVTGISAALGKNMRAPYNMLVTNVQGPPIPLYLAGAKLERLHIQMMQYAGLSLVIAVMTYAGQMFVTVVGHRENTPDLWTIPDEMQKEVQRLLAARPSKTP